MGEARTALFESTGEALALTATGYDMDTADEVAVEPIGTRIAYRSTGVSVQRYS